MLVWSVHANSGTVYAGPDIGFGIGVSAVPARDAIAPLGLAGSHRRGPRAIAEKPSLPLPT